MASETPQKSDVLQAHDHQKLSAEEIAKAVARHNKTHKSDKTQAGAAPSGKKAAKR